jgi:hypothetical protein
MEKAAVALPDWPSQEGAMSWQKVLLIVTVALTPALAGCGRGGPVTASCPAPLHGWYEPRTGRTLQEVVSRIRVEGREISWNGTRTNEAELAELLRVSRTVTPQPLIMFDPTGAESCAYAARVRDIIDREYDCRTNKCWQGSRQEYERAPLREGEVVLPW